MISGGAQARSFGRTRTLPDVAGPAPTLASRWFWLAAALLTAILMLPLVVVQYPGMPDYPNHLARAHIIVQEQLQGRPHPYYDLRHVLIPNLALDALVPLWVRWGMEVETALKLFAAFALLLPVAGVLALARVIQGQTPWLALLVFPLAYSRYYAWGFLNYFFTLGVVLLAYVWWRHLRPRQPVVAGFVLAFSAALAMMSHLVGFGVLALLVGCTELQMLWLRRSEGRGLLRSGWQPAAPALLALGACVVWYLLAFERGLPLDVRWIDGLSTKVIGLGAPFKAYSNVGAAVVGGLLIGALIVARRRGRLFMHRGWLLPVAVFGLAYLALPTVIMNSYYASARLLIVAVLVFLAHAALLADARWQKALLALAVLATALRCGEVYLHWSATSARVMELKVGLQALPDRAKTATVILVEKHGFGEIYPLRHVASFGVIQRDAFMPNFFGFPFNGESVAFRPTTHELVERFDKDSVIFTPQEPIPWVLYCSRYDAVLVIEMGRKAELPDCLRALRTGPGWAVYAVDEADQARIAGR